MTTVKEHFDVRTACWRDLGGCTTFHAVHVHVDFNPHATGTPLCSGGHGPPPVGGWPAPGSPALMAFTDAVSEKFPGLKLEFFNCRMIAGTTSWSQHAFHNAIDVMTPTVPIGQAVWDWLNGPWQAPPPPNGGDLVLTDDDAKQLGYNTVSDWKIQEDRAKAVSDVCAGRAKRTGQSAQYGSQYDTTKKNLKL